MCYRDSMNKQSLNRAIELEKQIEVLENELKALLAPVKNILAIYSTNYHPALYNISNVKIGSDRISFTASGIAMGEFKEYFSVTLDYIDDPRAYIAREIALKKEEEAREAALKKEKDDAEEINTYKKLKAKYEKV